MTRKCSMCGSYKQESEFRYMKKYFNECITKDGIFEEDFTLYFMKIAKEYIEQLEKTIKTISEEQTHKQDDYCRHYCNINIEHKYLISDKQKLIEKLKKDNNKDMESVKYYEQAKRDCQVDSEYKRIYQNYINELNAKRELRKEILEILKGERDE